MLQQTGSNKVAQKPFDRCIKIAQHCWAIIFYIYMVIEPL
nr:MAG TPA: hypothetical protein [Bacteriophage sp.]